MAFNAFKIFFIDFTIHPWSIIKVLFFLTFYFNIIFFILTLFRLFIFHLLCLFPTYNHRLNNRFFFLWSYSELKDKQFTDHDLQNILELFWHTDTNALNIVSALKGLLLIPFRSGHNGRKISVCILVLKPTQFHFR